jgi:hypothetical protein
VNADQRKQLRQMLNSFEQRIASIASADVPALLTYIARQLERTLDERVKRIL